MLGPDLIFIVLTMSKEDKNKRLMNRHDGDLQFVEFLEVKVYFFYPII